MKLFKEKFKPILIDLIKYEKDLLYNREHNIHSLPPSCIPHLLGRSWTDSELQYMIDNRQKAQELYERLKIQ